MRAKAKVMEFEEAKKSTNPQILWMCYQFKWYMYLFIYQLFVK